jgi:hypothetical protein
MTDPDAYALDVAVLASKVLTISACAGVSPSDLLEDVRRETEKPKGLTAGRARLRPCAGENS